MSEKKHVTLIPIAQVSPNKECIEAPSRLEKPISVSKETFDQQYRNNASPEKVSFEDDGVSNPQVVTTYTGAQPLFGRFIKAFKK